MAGLYSQFETDKDVEKKGVLLNYGQNSVGKEIAIRIARAGGDNRQYSKLFEAKIKPYRRQIQNETLDNSVAERITKEVYAQSVVLGWENVEFPVLDEHGNRTGEFEERSYSVENFIQLTTDLPDLWVDIQNQAGRATLFRLEILKADAKN